MEFQSLHKFYYILFLSILFLSSFLAQAKVTFKYCDQKGNYAVKVSGIEISPNPVVSGEPANFKISASSGKAISGGEVVIGVSYIGVTVHTERIDLCQEVTCPVSNGNFLISHTQTLPSITPPGPYALKVTLTDNSGELLTCIKFNFKIVFGSLVSDI
ncbi:PREDICTED: putative phosphatidylglycerol/phosphatidylinositol transfer protein DDB_G0282179 [Lupinus angustifolius]|uniref:putative phosphatidylglycerol/phosphatidylinositol transfer protein DDB_G0282179 n=1 Tax=Lupinus angustifolius TaxID=3871 RepID=UPI00092FCF8A|nr:PREDICTED: putative phosphatidylglycerol/phosphatidylinositol transfer protein DDB_G0282179 [Lupinus angustifolius]XP_019413100.1 PREDICTED: putative phosphatidylglycerol/phosphatidylinositol transfer protein DDB_G0282179 [Lupinus angustifolius]